MYTHRGYTPDTTTMVSIMNIRLVHAARYMPNQVQHAAGQTEQGHCDFGQKRLTILLCLTSMSDSYV